MPQDLSRVNGQYNDPYAFGGTGYGSISDALGRAWNNVSGITAQNAFNAEQAQISRDYDMYMSNSAYQRGVADMKAAGLNPASIGGQGNAVNPAQSFHSATARASSGSSSGGIPGMILGTLANVLGKGLAASITSAGRKAVSDDRNALSAMALKAKNEVESAKLALARDNFDLKSLSWDVKNVVEQDKTKRRMYQNNLDRAKAGYYDTIVDKMTRRGH